MRLRQAAAILLAVFALALLSESVKAEGEEVIYSYTSGTEAEENEAELFMGSELEKSKTITRTVLFSVSDLKSDKAWLMLSAETDTENGENEWPEYAGTPEGIYERLFQVRERIFDLSLTLNERGELNKELGQLYEETYRPDPETVNRYDNAWTLLLKRLSCTVEEEGEEGAKKACPLQKKTPLLDLKEGEMRRIRITLSCPEDLDEEERALLRQIRWRLTGEEYNSVPGLETEIILTNQPENGEYFVPGETASVQMTYYNTGAINLMHVIVRLMRETSGEERTELDHDTLGLMTSKKTPGPEGPSSGGMGREIRISEADAKRGFIRLFAEVEASCVSPEYPERIYAESELRIPVGKAGKRSEEESNEEKETDPGEAASEAGNPTAAADGLQTAGEGAGTDTGQPDKSAESTEEGTGFRLWWLILIVTGISAIAAGVLVLRHRR